MTPPFKAVTYISGWRRNKLYFKGSEEKAEIELVQVELRGKGHGLQISNCDFYTIPILGNTNLPPKRRKFSHFFQGTDATVGDSFSRNGGTLFQDTDATVGEALLPWDLLYSPERIAWEGDRQTLTHKRTSRLLNQSVPRGDSVKIYLILYLHGYYICRACRWYLPGNI